MATDMMFTREEAVSFLQNSWGVQRVAERFQTARQALLEEIATSAQTHVPFQSFAVMSVPPEQCRRPSVDSIKRDCMAGIGGVCYTLNAFAWSLLKAVGYSAWLCVAAVHRDVKIDHDNHLLILVKDLEKEGDVHLVDCGSGFPTFRAVSLDFPESSPVFRDSFLEYKYIRHGGLVLRMHGDGDKGRRNDPPVDGVDLYVGKWRRFCSFAPVPLDSLSDCSGFFENVYTDAQHSFFLNYPPLAISFPNRRASILVHNRLMLERENGELETRMLGGDDEIVDAYLRHFPGQMEDVVRAALHRWNSKQARIGVVPR